MEIAKYIGQFLLKNSFCYIHGLGNLELVKRPATHDGKTLQAPVYEVVLTAGGSIDDSFANFIATNEQISISKAANALRDFSIETKKTLQSGESVDVPGLGKFVQDGPKIKFVTDSNFSFTPPGMPALKNSRQLEEQKSATPHKPATPVPQTGSSVNWSMVIIASILVVILAGAGYGYYYYTSHNNNQLVPVKDTVIAVPPPVAPPVDTTNKVDTVLTPPPVDTLAVMPFDMLIGEYAARDKAEKRYRQLKINGTKVELMTQDSINYKLLTTVNCRLIDTLHVKDSLAKLFGFKNVAVYKK